MKKIILLAGAIMMGGTAFVLAAEPTPDIQQIWKKTCANCHGIEGKADTKMGRKIGALDFTDAKNQVKFSDEQMFKTIKEGVKEKDGKFKMKSAENVTDDQIKGLIAFIRTLKK